MDHISYKKERPFWYEDWFMELSKDEQEKRILALSDEEFEAEKKKDTGGMLKRSPGESDAEYQAAAEAFMEWENWLLCLRMDESDSSNLEEEADKIVSMLEELGFETGTSADRGEQGHIEIGFGMPRSNEGFQ